MDRPFDLEAGVRWRASWVKGTGRFALLSRCGSATVTLHDDIVLAMDGCDDLHEKGCGSHHCTGSHAVYDLTLDRDAQPVYVTPPETPRNAVLPASDDGWPQR